MTTLPLNLFQRVVRSWDETHPYNAAQVMRLDPAAGPPQRWRDAWGPVLRAGGLGRVIVEGDRYRYEPDAAPPAVACVPACCPLERYLGDELNRPFTSDSPFRPFIRPSAEGLDVGIVYQHWVADSVAIRLLLRRWFEAALGLTPADAARPLALATGGYWHHFGPGRVPWGVGSALLDMLRTFSRFRHVRRLRSGGSRDYTKALLIRTAPQGLATALRRAARARDVTVNDLFIAAAIEQCARHLPLRPGSGRRAVALGSIVDLRPLDAEHVNEHFGLFLGFTNVILPTGDLKDVDRLIRIIHAQTRNAKERHAAAAGMLWLLAAQAAARFLPSDRAYQFYRKHMPLAGGISNVNLNRSWAAAHHPHLIRQYLRISPTGPMIPVAFTPTTLGEDLHLAMSYRTALIKPPRAGAMADGFIQRLVDLAGQA